MESSFSFVALGIALFLLIVPYFYAWSVFVQNYRKMGAENRGTTILGISLTLIFLILINVTAKILDVVLPDVADYYDGISGSLTQLTGLVNIIVDAAGALEFLSGYVLIAYIVIHFVGIMIIFTLVLEMFRFSIFKYDKRGVICSQMLFIIPLIIVINVAMYVVLYLPMIMAPEI